MLLIGSGTEDQDLATKTPKRQRFNIAKGCECDIVVMGPLPNYRQRSTLLSLQIVVSAFERRCRPGQDPACIPPVGGLVIDQAEVYKVRRGGSII